MADSDMYIQPLMAADYGDLHHQSNVTMKTFIVTWSSAL